jgi:hypothetical protein
MAEKKGWALTLARTATVLLVGLAGVATVAPSPAYAASCGGDSCSGRDPQASGCSPGAYDVGGTQHWEDRFSYSMRKSDTCNARWGRLVWEKYSGFTATLEIESQRYVQGPGWLPKDSQTVTYHGPGTYWTHMVADGSEDRFRLCSGSSCQAWVY